MVLVDRDFFAKLFCSSLLSFEFSCKPLRSIFTIAVVLGCSTTSAFAADTKDTQDPALKNGVALFGSASYSQAITEFDKVANSKQSGDIARYYRALCYQQQKQYKAARDEFLYLYYKAQDKNVRYKSWQALKTLPQTAQAAAKTKTTVAKQDGPGADAWIMPTEGYGRSGPAATSQTTVTIIPTSCSRRGR